MKSTVVCVVCCLTSWTSAASSQEQAGVRRDQTVNEKRYTIEFPGGTFADAVKLLHDKTGASILCDSFVNDIGVNRKTLTEATLPQIAEYVGLQVQRQVFFQNAFIVLRHKQWWMEPAREEFSRKNYGLRWKNEGTAVIRRDGVEPALLEVRIVSLDAEASAEKLARLVAATPARYVSLQVSAAPLRIVSEKMLAGASTRLQVARKFQDRRVTCYASSVAPGQFADALRLLLFGNLELVIGQSDEQSALEALMIDKTVSGMSDREKLSRELEQEIAKLLTPEQQAAYQSGKDVVIPIGSMPGPVGELSIRFITGAYADLSANSPDLPGLDHSRLRQGSIVANIKWKRLGADAYLQDGRGVHF